APAGLLGARRAADGLVAAAARPLALGSLGGGLGHGGRRTVGRHPLRGVAVLRDRRLRVCLRRVRGLTLPRRTDGRALAARVLGGGVVAGGRAVAALLERVALLMRRRVGLRPLVVR